MSLRHQTLLLVLAACLLTSCEGDHGSANAASMQRGLAQSETLELVSPPGAVGARAERSLLRWCGVLGINLTRVDSFGGSPQNPRVVIGSINEPGVKELLASTGVELGAEGEVRWVDRVFEGPGVAIVATFEDPERPGLPVTVFAGNTMQALESLALDLRPLARPGARLFRGGRMSLSVDLRVSGAPLEESIIDYEERWQGFEQELISVPLSHKLFDLKRRPGVEEGVARAWSERSIEAMTRIESWAGSLSAPLHVALTSELEEVQRIYGVCRFGVAEPARRTVIAVAHSALPEEGRRSLAEAQLVDSLGFPYTDWMLEAAAVDAVDSWWGKPLEEWLAYLSAQGLVPSPTSTVTPGALRDRSDHIRIPVQAAFFRYLREHLDPEQLVELWRGEEAYAVDDIILEDFQSWLDELCAPQLVGLRAARVARHKAILEVDRRDGVAIDSPLDTQRSFVVPALAKTLDRARDLGVDALSVQCYWLEDGPQPRFAAGAGPELSGFVEPDAELAHILGLARERGMRTCLVPVQLVSSSAGRSAWLRRTSAPAWRDFFVYQRRMLEHGGLLAELMGVELLSLGVELQNASRTRPEEESDLSAELFETKRKGWSESISFARAVFSGGLTYGALWRQELEEVEFWSELDYIGLAYYPRLGTPLGERPSDRAIQGSMTKVLREFALKGESLGLPVLLLEVGFPSSSRAWWDTSLGQGELDLEEQMRLYSSFAGALGRVRAETDLIRGTYLWRWEIEPGSGGARDRGFSPQGKPAETVIENLYR